MTKSRKHTYKLPCGLGIRISQQQYIDGIYCPMHGVCALTCKGVISKEERVNIPKLKKEKRQ